MDIFEVVEELRLNIKRLNFLKRKCNLEGNYTLLYQIDEIYNSTKEIYNKYDKEQREIMEQLEEREEINEEETLAGEMEYYDY